MSKEFVICKFCGSRDDLHWIDEVKIKLIQNNYCFECQIWFEMVETKDDSTHCVIQKSDNKIYHYIFYPDIPGNKPAMRGFGGSKFKILFNDGREVETRNLWHQGEVPERFYNLLPVNAKFVYG